MNIESNSKILLMVNSLSAGGAERVTLGLFDYLISIGCDVYLFVTYWQDSSTQVYELHHPDRVFHSSDIANSKFRSLANLALLRRVASRLRPAIVVSLGCSYRLIEAAGLFRNARVMLSERNWPPSYYSDGGARACAFYEKAACVVFQTEEARSCFPESSIKKAAVIPNPAPVGLPAWSGSGSKTIVYFGRFDKQKNPLMSIKAFQEFLKSNPKYRLEMYGIGALEEEMRCYISEQGLGQSVCIYPPRKDIWAYASKCLMFINSSDYEGISNSMIESLAMGVPTVCTDCFGGGAKMMIQDGINGLLVQRGDVEGMARAMNSIASDLRFAAQLSENSIQRIELYSPKVVYSQWESLLRGLLENK